MARSARRRNCRTLNVKSTKSEPPLDRVALIIPAYNEEASLRELLPLLTPLGLGQLIVANNASTDATADVAREHGATVIYESQRGYGAACAAGIAAVATNVEVVAFLDADLCDDPAFLPQIVQPILEDRADMVIGCRDPHLRESGSMTPPQAFGTWLATRLIRLRWRYRYRDLGPFRAIRKSSLMEMDMQDRAFGWTVEMQIRALQMGLRIEQISVPYRRRRAGKSKISGTIRGVYLAGYYILTTIGRHWFRGRG